jgi:hypothetical protein
MSYQCPTLSHSYHVDDTVPIEYGLEGYSIFISVWTDASHIAAVRASVIPDPAFSDCSTLHKKNQHSQMQPISHNKTT